MVDVVGVSAAVEATEVLTATDVVAAVAAAAVFFFPIRGVESMD